MEVVDKIRESVSAISDLTEMGLLDQAEQLCRNSVGEWGRHTDLVRLQELIDAKQLAKERSADNGSKYCPVCGESFKDFLPLPEYYVQNMLRHRFKHIGRGEMTSIDEYSCPSCGASDRERLYAAWIKHESTSRRIYCEVIGNIHLLRAGYRRSEIGRHKGDDIEHKYASSHLNSSLFELKPHSLFNKLTTGTVFRHQLFRSADVFRRFISERIIDAATPTFNDSILPTRGIATLASHAVRRFADIPEASEPKSTAHLRG